MKEDKIYIKSLVFGIIIILLGAAVVPSISGQNNKINNQNNNIELISFPINDDDYINAHWKFDQGSGSTAYDSSGHGYHGNINGATWTSGYSSYALDFDGVNDYVEFDEHAKNYLGFNRTDDLIYTFYFQTSSTKKGIIYSTCRGDSYGYNPGFHIAMLADGKFEVQMWRLSCGILMSGTNAYNDGSWHKAEIIFNGGSAHCRVEVYVDDEFDSYYEKYVCSFFSDNFRYAQIGRHSHEEIDYFDGKIDEFKIIKFPGGNQHQLPTITGPELGQPGVEYTFTIVSDDPEGDDVSYYVDWGDGTNTGWTDFYPSGQEVYLKKTYNEEGAYYIRARCKDSWGTTGWVEHLIRIGNQAPDPPVITGNRYGNAGQEITYTFASFDYEGQDVKYTIDWGDGDTDVTGFYTHNTPIERSHSWAVEGDYDIKARAEDTTGRKGEWSIYSIRIGDQPPDSPNIYGAVQGKPGEKFEYGFVSTDPENDNLTFDIDWGDGNLEIDRGPVLSGEFFTRSHTWENTGTYIIRVRANDIYNYSSPWTEQTIIIYTKGKSSNFNLINVLIERFPRAYLAFRNFINIGERYR